MRCCRMLLLTVWMLALCASLPCLAQENATEQNFVVNQEADRLRLLDKSALAIRQKEPDAAIRNFDFGGEYRMRFHNESNHRPSPTLANGLGLTGTDDNFLLYRTRLWMDATVNERVGVYVEILDAESNHENFTPRGNEVDRLNLHQGYADIAITDQLQVKLGRRSLDIGSTRFAGMGEWANTRRAFDGLQATLAGEHFDYDAYYLHTLSMRTHDYNKTNTDTRLYGINAHRHVDEGTIRDYYWLTLELDRVDARYDTLGTQWKGARDEFLYEFEGAVQLGRNPDQTDHLAGFTVVGLGKDLQGQLPGELWVYYEWASGSDTPGNGFHHYFPRAHRHLGYMDLFGRRNLNDLNVRWNYQPTESLEMRVHYHYFSLANSADVPYNTNMTAFAGLGANTSGSSDLGHEIDLLATYTFSDRLKFQFGYPHFFAGRYYDTTAGAPYAGDARFFYTQMSLKF